MLIVQIFVENFGIKMARDLTNNSSIECPFRYLWHGKNLIT